MTLSGDRPSTSSYAAIFCSTPEYLTSRRPGPRPALHRRTAHGQAEFATTVPITYGLGGGIVCGAGPGSPVTEAYSPPFAFSGVLHEVTVEVGSDLIRDDEAEMRLVMARQ